MKGHRFLSELREHTSAGRSLCLVEFGDESKHGWVLFADHLTDIGDQRCGCEDHNTTAKTTTGHSDTAPAIESTCNDIDQAVYSRHRDLKIESKRAMRVSQRAQGYAGRRGRQALMQ